MLAVIILGILAVSFAWLAKYRNVAFGLNISFTLIFIFLALRYNFGNDYKGYLDIFIEINKYKSFDLFDKSIHAEPGWILLCKLFKPFGFFAMTAILSLLHCFIYYSFIKKFVPIRYYWLAVFLYIFNSGFLLVQASAMRQSVAIEVFIFSLSYLYKKDAIRYFLCVGIAWLFHSSAVILLPIYLLTYINGKINKGGIIILASIFIATFIFIGSIGPYLNQFVNIYFNQYEGYKEAVVLGSGLGLLFIFIPFFLTLNYERFQSRETALIFKLVIISFIFIPLGFIIQLIGRMGMYFMPATLIVYPVIQMNLKTAIYKYLFLGSLALITLYEFFMFFQSDVWRDAFGNYQTIFSASKYF